MIACPGMPSIPGSSSVSTGVQRETMRSMQEQALSGGAGALWVFLPIFFFYACFLLLVIQNINAILMCGRAVAMVIDNFWQVSG